MRTWYQLYKRDGIDGLALGHKGGFCRLGATQSEQLRTWVVDTLPGTARQVGADILAAAFGISYESPSGLIKLLHRLGLEHRKPRTIARKLDPARQAA